MEWLARSANPEKGCPAQTYARHVRGVRAYVERSLDALSKRVKSTVLYDLRRILLPAVDAHDLGKLETANQDVLNGKRKANSLPVIHTDAGAVDLMGRNDLESALLVASHHIGLPDFVRLANTNEEDLLRVEDPLRRMKEPLKVLRDRHFEALGEQPGDCSNDAPINVMDGGYAVFYRVALSLLVDADHSDSSQPGRSVDDIAMSLPPPLLPEKRLAALNTYVSAFKSDSQRNILRSDIYAECKNYKNDASVVACDSPVGSGKTTAVMAHLLAVAKAKNLRRIFVVLPYTNIIRQSAETYRKALVLPEENADDVVAEVHHLADFDDEVSREYATQWKAPIVVTTAVAFFETLAAARPSALRRLHELVASAVFVDEAHAAVPAKFLPVIWRWVNVFSDDWNVHWVLASGSLVHFWKMPEVVSAIENIGCRNVPMLVSDELRERSNQFEVNRVIFETLPNAVSVEELLDKVCETPGPRIVIVNTIQNAAVVAKYFHMSQRFAEVFHLATALTPAARETTLNGVRGKLSSSNDDNWVLVGTSCIEAGVDLDFASGFREIASLTSLLQSSGRVNRSGKRKESQVFSFQFKNSDELNTNPSLEDSSRVLRQFIESSAHISPELCTEALQRELQLNPSAESLLKKLVNEEINLRFPQVERLFKIITADTRTVIVNRDIVHRIESFEQVDWREIQKHSVQIWGYRIEDLHIPEINHHSGVYAWHLNYSPFLGIMEGILGLSDFERNGGGVI